MQELKGHSFGTGLNQDRAELYAMVTIKCPLGCPCEIEFSRLLVGWLSPGELFAMKANPLELQPNAKSPDGDRRPTADCPECGMTARMTRPIAEEAAEGGIDWLRAHKPAWLLRPPPATEPEFPLAATA